MIGRDLDVAVALTRPGHVISDIGTLKLRYSQTRTGDRAPSQERVQTANRRQTSQPTSRNQPTQAIGPQQANSPLPRVLSEAQCLATPQGLTVGPPSHDSVPLSWSALTDQTNLASYRIDKCANSDCSDYDTKATVPKGTTSTIITKLERLLQYRFRITALAVPGSEACDSTPSTIVTAGTTNQLAAVKGLAAATPSTNADTEVELTWNAPASSMNLANFWIQRCASSACGSPVTVASPAETATAHTATNLSRNTTYHFRIKAVADANSTIEDSAWSTTVSHTPAKTTVKITNFRVLAYASDNLQLEWDLPANRETTIKRYILKQCPSANNCTTPLNTWPTSTYDTAFANPRNLQQDTDYCFTIEAELLDTLNKDDFEVPVSVIHTFRTTN